MSELPHNSLTEAKKWLAESREELDAALALKGHSDIRGRIICLHAHLTAEKSIKALLIFRDILVPRVHDLFDLLSRLADKDKFNIDENDLEILNPWSIRGRYPADLPDATNVMVEHALIAAQNVYDAANSTIN